MNLHHESTFTMDDTCQLKRKSVSITRVETGLTSFHNVTIYRPDQCAISGSLKHRTTEKRRVCCLCFNFDI